MPSYDYRCSDCGREIEVMHGIHASGPTTCDACGGAMRKALSTPAIHFKGSGWAKKDAATSARSAKAASTGADKPSGSEPASEAASGSKGDSAKGSPASAGSKAD